MYRYHRYTQVPYKYHGTSKDILTGFSRTLPVPLWTEAAKSIILSSFSFYRVVYIQVHTQNTGARVPMQVIYQVRVSSLRDHLGLEFVDLSENDLRTTIAGDLHRWQRFQPNCLFLASIGAPKCGLHRAND